MTTRREVLRGIGAALVGVVGGVTASKTEATTDPGPIVDPVAETPPRDAYVSGQKVYTDPSSMGTLCGPWGPVGVRDMGDPDYTIKGLDVDTDVWEYRGTP